MEVGETEEERKRRWRYSKERFSFVGRGVGTVEWGKKDKVEDGESKGEGMEEGKGEECQRKEI